MKLTPLAILLTFTPPTLAQNFRATCEGQNAVAKGIPYRYDLGPFFCRRVAPDPTYGYWYNMAYIELDECVGNRDGEMVHMKGGHFMKSCRNTHYEPRWAENELSAECKTKSGKWVKTSITLNKFISNQNGSLRC